MMRTMVGRAPWCASLAAAALLVGCSPQQPASESEGVELGAPEAELPAPPITVRVQAAPGDAARVDISALDLSGRSPSGQLPVLLLLPSANLESDAAALASVFGLDPAPVSGASDAPTLLRFVPPASSPLPAAAELTVDASGAWYFSAAVQSAVYSCEQADSTQPDQPSSNGCDLASLDAPSLGRVSDLWLSRLGLSGQVGQLTPQPQYGSFSQHQLLFDGVVSDLAVGLGFTHAGELAYAYGHLVSAAPVGTFPVLDEREALSRFSPALATWYDLPDGALRPVSSTSTLSSVVDVDGARWLIPAYAVRFEDGVTATVPALAEPALQLLFDDGPSASDGSPAGGSAADMGAAGEEAASPPDSSVQLAERVLGLPEAEAALILDESGTPWRLSSRDDQSFPGTMDFRPERLNLKVEGGVVAQVTFG